MAAGGPEPAADGTAPGPRLSPAQVAQFERDGFLAGVELLSPARLTTLRAAVAAVIADLDRLEPELYEVERAHRDRPDEVVCHFLGGWRVHPALRELVFLPAATVPSAQLLGVDQLRFWHDQVFAKPPRHPGVVPWHQDYSYWTRTAPACHITVNILLDDADEQNGCVHYLPGSHRWGLLPTVPFDAPVESIRPLLPPGAQWRPVAATGRQGTATIHHCMTLHGSYGNRSDRWRRACVLNYMGAHVRVADGSSALLRGAPVLAAGSVVAGELFPLVLDRGVPLDGSGAPVRA